MCFGGGGGGGGGDNGMSYFANIQRDMANRADQQAQQEKNDLMASHNQIIADIVGGGGQRRGETYFRRQGLDPSAYSGDIAQLVSDTIPNIPNLDPNPASYFGDDLFAGLVDQLQTGGRNIGNRQVQSTFGPGYENTVFPDSTVDSIVNDILGTQQTAAQTNLDYQHKRGALTDEGYNTAEARLGDQANSARSTLRGVAEGVLGKDRQAISDIVGQAGNAANTWSLGMPAFDVSPYKNMVTDRANTLRSSFGGDVRSALGNTELFDIPTLIASAGSAQGPSNLTTEGAPFGEPKKQVKSRGLGSTGVF